MTIAEIIAWLEKYAPPCLQESYDNSGLLIGDKTRECTGVLCTLDSTPEVIAEAITMKCNLIVSHHPVIFKGLKTLAGDSQIERAVIGAIKNDVAVYAMHTNLDNILSGVNGKMADKLGLLSRRVLQPKAGNLRKIFTYIPSDHLEKVRSALFEAGGGQIGNYSECSFVTTGSGTFKAGEGATPFIGKIGVRHVEQESRLEVIFPAARTVEMINALKKSHPYEEVAFEVIELENMHPEIGSGLIGKLPQPLQRDAFLSLVKDVFQTEIIRHTSPSNQLITTVAVCGGAGSFLSRVASEAGADAFISSDFKYHEFQNGGPNLMICDVGHFESEHFTIDLIAEILLEKFRNFAVLKSRVRTNPVNYYH